MYPIRLDRASTGGPTASHPFGGASDRRDQSNLSNPAPSITPNRGQRHRVGCSSLGTVAKPATLSPAQRRIQRALEVAPGALTWTILIAPVVASFVFAPYIALAIFLVDIYWFVRTGTVVVGIRSTYRTMKRTAAEDWWQRCLTLGVGPGLGDPRRIVHAVLILTDLDSDFRVHRQYFAYVTYHYVTDKRGPESIFQPIPMFHNNLWRVPFAVRIMASACTQWQMFLSSRPDRLVAFSSYSMSLDLVIKADYWDDDVIPEDSRFYWKSFFATHGRLQMVPVFLPIYGDAPEASDRGMPWERVKTHANQYNQIKRWAWGVSDIPYVTVRLLRHTEIPLWLKARRYGYMIFNHLTWTTLPILLLFGAALPRLLQEDWNLTTAADRLALYAFILINIAFLNIAALILVERRINPPMPRSWGPAHQIWAYVQLGLYPIVGLLFSVLPALEAQTRLMLGMYLEYQVTEKVSEGTA